VSGPADPPAAPRPPPAWQAWLGAGISAALLAAILWQLRRAAGGVAPPRLAPAAWAVFGLLYLVQPLCDFAVYRRLWGLPLAGLPPLLRKNVINETVLGYSGEIYFYVWARRRVGPQRAPFQTIKDVAIVSALISNLVTLAMLAAAASQRDLDLARRFGPAFWPAVALTLLPFALLAFPRRVFRLPPRCLADVAAIHLVRAVAVSGLTVLLWRLALPEVPLGAWAVLLAVRLVLTRVPFVSNKDLLFGNLVLLIAPPPAPVAVVLGSLALATLATHLAVIALLGAGDLVRMARGGSARV
jgi:hypothetical protein